MFEKVLLTMDFSHHALKLMECMGEIPGISEVVVLHVIDTARIAHGEETKSRLIKKAQLELDEHKERLESLGLTVETRVSVGIPSKEIIRTANETGTSLIVMGARGQSLVRDILLGSVPSDVVRYGSTHVLIMRYRVVDQMKGEEFEKYCDRIFSRVLIPLDFSQQAEDALSIIRQLPGIGEIVLVRVVEQGDTREALERTVEQAQVKVKGLEAELKEAGLETRSHVHIGDPAHEINTVAQEEDVSLIAVGTGGKGLIDEIRAGSTAEAVVRNAGRPVLVIRT